MPGDFNVMLPHFMPFNVTQTLAFIIAGLCSIARMPNDVNPVDCCLVFREVALFLNSIGTLRAIKPPNVNVMSYEREK